jgi:hypothetical protein
MKISRLGSAAKARYGIECNVLSIFSVADFELPTNMMPGKKAATINRSFVGALMAAND